VRSATLGQQRFAAVCHARVAVADPPRLLSVDIGGVERVVERVGEHPVRSIFGALSLIQGEKLRYVNGFQASDTTVAGGFDPPALDWPPLGFELGGAGTRRNRRIAAVSEVLLRVLGTAAVPAFVVALGSYRSRAVAMLKTPASGWAPAGNDE
jgi:hypothetical protein